MCLDMETANEPIVSAGRKSGCGSATAAQQMTAPIDIGPRVHRSPRRYLMGSIGPACMATGIVLLDTAGFWFYNRGYVCFGGPCPAPGFVNLLWLPWVTLGVLIALALFPMVLLIDARWLILAFGRAATLSVAAFPIAWFIPPLKLGPGWEGWPAVYQPGGPLAAEGDLIVVSLCLGGAGLTWLRLLRASQPTASTKPSMRGPIAMVWAVVFAWSVDSTLAAVNYWPYLAMAAVLAGGVSTALVVSLTKTRIRGRPGPSMEG